MAPYRKSAKRTYFKKRTVSKPKVSTAVKKYVKRTVSPLKPELKRYIDTYTETTIDAAVTPYYIYEPAIAQGTGAYQRVGNQVKMSGLYARVMFKNNATATAMLRVLLVHTGNDTDTAAATMELFKDTNSAGSTGTITASGTSANNIILQINKAKFKVLYDNVFKLGATGSTDGKDVLMFKRFFKLGNKLVRFDGGATGVGNTSDRYLLIYLISETALDSAGGAIEISGQNKWFFIDA